ncbi:hypothetical protein N657DRAFT_650886 [Parathielavia appendiculata]|uniref:Uncharacterized protein n=1 Tax=Parathielavia appendiculata TaxID=2587402 RepID=A0AAN6TQH2_9PEZI|nr:hypothetical protein N657DRAFT_650886 [Parathielavia appendiculata]
MNPLLPQPNRPGHLFTYVAALPVKRIPVVASRFTIKKPQNQISFLMQAVGDGVPEHEACAKCAGRIGVYRKACVVVRDPEVVEITGGGCANCWYSRQGSICTFRSPTPTQQQSAHTTVSARETHIPVPRIPAPFQPVTRLPDLPVQAPAPLHPSYVAALAAGAVAASPTPVMASNATLADPASLLRDNKIRAWESRYAKMNIRQPAACP